MNNSSLLDILILVGILGFIGTLDINNLSTLQSLGILSGIGWIILMIFRLIKQGKTASKNPVTKTNVKAKRNKK